MAVAVLAGAACAVALRLWVVEPVTVSSVSMEPTVTRGETVLLWHVPRPSGRLAGSLVAFRDPRSDAILIKRVAADAGQAFEILDGVVTVDGVPRREPYVNPRRTDGTFFPRVVVPPGHVFVLGDNRTASVDSRDYGPIPVNAITATVVELG